MGAGTFARSHTFVAGEILTAVNQNGIETNIINNFNFAGLDDYSSSLAEMRTTTDPYLAAAESQATDGKGELERYRYILAQITGRTYWYQDIYPIMAEGADIASATTCDIWAAFDGSTKHITGTTTITSFGTAPQAGCWMKVIFDGALTLTHGANLNLPGSANIITAANDWAFVYADTTTLFRVLYFRAYRNGRLVQSVIFQTGTAATGTTTLPSDNTIPQNTEGDQYMSLAITPKNTNNRLIVRVGWSGGTTAASGNALVVALFRDTTADALACTSVTNSANGTHNTGFTYYTEGAIGVVETTFKVRAGTNVAGTTQMAGYGGGALYNGAYVSFIEIMEVEY